MAERSLRIKALGQVPYAETFAAMQAFTARRTGDTEDELWLLEHPPVFTQGQAGKPEHLLLPGDIPVVQSDRGGQVTYHGPGQLVGYVLVDLTQRGYGIRSLVERIEAALIQVLAGYGISAYSDRDAPGVYVDVRARRHKIASLGLRVKSACSYHGLALNVGMDLEPFSRINPCGYQGLAMTQINDLVPTKTIAQVAKDLTQALEAALARPT